MNHGTKFGRLCLKLLLPTILTSSLPFYPYQKDERALPGYLLTRCSFSPSDIKRLSLSLRCFLFTSTLILPYLTLFLFNKMRLFLPPRKIVSLTSPVVFLFESTLHISFPSLSLGSKGLNIYDSTDEFSKKITYYSFRISYGTVCHNDVLETC
jgi:hypothetical protein